MILNMQINIRNLPSLPFPHNFQRKNASLLKMWINNIGSGAAHAMVAEDRREFVSGEGPYYLGEMEWYNDSGGFFLDSCYAITQQKMLSVAFSTTVTTGSRQKATSLLVIAHPPFHCRREVFLIRSLLSLLSS